MLREILAWLRLAHATRSVQQYMDDLDRARDGLSKSLQAQADALATVRALDIPPAPVMESLRKGRT
jgi:hypothetical protein